MDVFLPSGNWTVANWKIAQLQLIYLWKVGMFNIYVRLPEGRREVTYLCVSQWLSESLSRTMVISILELEHQNGCFMMKKNIEMDDLGLPHL